MKSDKFHSNLMDIQSNMLNFAYMLTSNKDAAYGLMHDTTAAALEGHESFGDEDNFKSWIFGIMRDVFKANYSKADIRTECIATRDYALVLDGDEASLPDGCYDVNSLTEKIKRMPKTCGEYFVLHVKGYTAHEIADRVNMSLHTVIENVTKAFHYLTA